MSRILRGNDLWKSVENFSGAVASPSAHGGPGQFTRSEAPGVISQALRACSACAGDYEDPDRTAWTTDSEDVEEQLQDDVLQTSEERDEPDDDFPAREK